MIKKILRVICVICTAVCVIAFIGLSFVNRILFCGNIIPDMTDEEYISYMHDRIATAVAENEEYYGFDISYLTNKIDDEQIKLICDSYFSQLEEVIRGKRDTLDAISYPNEGFAEGVLDFADTLDIEDGQFDPEAADEIATDAASVASACFSAIPEKYLGTVKNLINSPKLGLVKYYYIPLIAALVFAALCVIIPGETIISKCTLAASSAFIPSLGMFTFMVLTYMYDFADKVVIAESPLRQLILRVFGTLCRDGLNICGICTVISGGIMFALLIVRSVLIITQSKKNNV